MTTYPSIRFLAVILAGLLTTEPVFAQDTAPSKLKLPTDVTAPAQPAQKRDSLWNGALIGAAVGGALAIYDYSIDPSEPSNRVIFVTAIGLGAAIGTGVDALISKNASAAIVRVTPLMRKHQRGLVVIARF